LLLKSTHTATRSSSNSPPPPDPSTLSLHDALPISPSLKAIFPPERAPAPTPPAPRLAVGTHYAPIRPVYHSGRSHCRRETGTGTTCTCRDPDRLPRDDH